MEAISHQPRFDLPNGNTEPHEFAWHRKVTRYKWANTAFLAIEVDECYPRGVMGSLVVSTNVLEKVLLAGLPKHAGSCESSALNDAIKYGFIDNALYDEVDQQRNQSGNRLS